MHPLHYARDSAELVAAVPSRFPPPSLRGQPPRFSNFSPLPARDRNLPHIREFPKPGRETWTADAASHTAGTRLSVALVLKLPSLRYRASLHVDFDPGRSFWPFSKN